MTALREFQAGFRAYLADGEAEAVASHFTGGFAGNAGIYRNNVRHAHAGALASIFPAVRALVGEAYFDGIASRFAQASPPRSAVMAAYGASFADHLAARPELDHFPFLPDVARLEWAMNVAFHAHSDFFLRPEAAQELFAGGDFELRPIDSVHTVVSRFPVHDIRSAALAGDEDALRRTAPGDTQLLVYRPEGEVRVIAISKAEAAFINSLGLGRAVEDGFFAAIETDPAFSPAEALGRLIHLGVFKAPTHAAKENDND